jgi:hypothetical protein
LPAVPYIYIGSYLVDIAVAVGAMTMEGGSCHKTDPCLIYCLCLELFDVQ